MAKPEKKQKRAELPKQCTQTSEFKKSWERYKRAGLRDMNEVRQVMVTLFLGAPLPAEYLDHALTGDWAGFRECHIGLWLAPPGDSSCPSQTGFSIAWKP
ncbi:type II toxin-antitoxin system YafQ family toxin [Pseudomonas fluorescens]|uniref:type II toxin-antitoxin system YafQ family toxin n=1 Tax=Pseudomonas fluorescens TaxID=294 RepID=UPI0009BA49F6